jgi:hypothetical protein
LPARSCILNSFRTGLGRRPRWTRTGWQQVSQSGTAWAKSPDGARQAHAGNQLLTQRQVSSIAAVGVDISGVIECRRAVGLPGDRAWVYAIDLKLLYQSAIRGGSGDRYRVRHHEARGQRACHRGHRRRYQFGHGTCAGRTRHIRPGQAYASRVLGSIANSAGIRCSRSRCGSSSGSSA